MWAASATYYTMTHGTLLMLDYLGRIFPPSRKTHHVKKRISIKNLRNILNLLTDSIAKINDLAYVEASQQNFFCGNNNLIYRHDDDKVLPLLLFSLSSDFFLIYLTYIHPFVMYFSLAFVCALKNFHLQSFCFLEVKL